MSLAEIIGQEKAIGMLTGFLERQRLANSYIFSGEPGIGKRLTAINFAKAINCQNSEATSELRVSNSGLSTRPDACDMC